MATREKKQKTIEGTSFASLYFWSSIALVLVSIWSIWDDAITRRPWKSYHREFYTRYGKITVAALEEARKQVDTKDLEEQRAKAEADLTRNPLYRQLQDTLRTATVRLQEAEQEYQFAKSDLVEAKYFLHKNYLEGKETSRYEAEVQRWEAEVQRVEPIRDAREKDVTAITTRMAQVSAERDRLQKEIEKRRADVTRLERLNASLKERWPEIQQVVVEKLDRVDRCQTCHMGVALKEFAEAPQPFRTHPDVTTRHDPDLFGCTVCHHGQGRALTVKTAHAQDPKVAEYWLEPMYTSKEVEASCRGCHVVEAMDRLTWGPTLTQGLTLMQWRGCFGCHAVEGFETYAKIGPDLRRISAKTTAQWVVEWIKDPKAFNAHARMPNFRFSDAEARAIAAYLLTSGDEYHPLPLVLPAAFSPDQRRRGEELVGSVGCLGCHAINGKGGTFAPELSGIGNKVTARWLASWLSNPWHYLPGTAMPNLRLTGEELPAVVAYLMSLTAKGRSPDPAYRLDMSPTAVKQGERLVGEYGCFGCHEITGMEKRAKVAPDLSDFAGKPVDRLDFGNTRAQEIARTWHDWTRGKLSDPRRYATRDIVQKMPDFGFSKQEIDTLLVALLSFRGERLPKEWVAANYPASGAIARGRQLLKKYNCQGCHVLEKTGGQIRELYDDPGLAPPLLDGEGEKVQPTWLFNFLKEPKTLRPWVKIRMPTFGLPDQEASTLVEYFAALAKMDTMYVTVDLGEIDPASLAAGRVIFDKFQCLQCHVAGKVAAGLAAADLAPDLALAKERLRPAWIETWLRDPQKVTDGTRMPTYFPDDQSPLPTIFGGDAKKQIRALRDYILTLAGPRPPVVRRERPAS